MTYMVLAVSACRTSFGVLVINNRVLLTYLAFRNFIIQIIQFMTDFFLMLLEGAVKLRDIILYKTVFDGHSRKNKETQQDRNYSLSRIPVTPNQQAVKKGSLPGQSITTIHLP